MNEYQRETLEEIADALAAIVKRIDRILYLMEKPPWDVENDTNVAIPQQR